MEMKGRIDKNKIYITEALPSELNRLEREFTKLAKNYYFNPLYKRKLWDGTIKFLQHKKLPAGLWNELEKICSECDYKLEWENKDSLFDNELTMDDFNEWVTFYFKNSKIKPRDYQIQSAFEMLKARRCIAELATSAGKTLILFMVWSFLKTQKNIQKFLIIVPSVTLVNQTWKEFKTYDTKGLLKKLKCQLLYHGSSQKDENPHIIISTWQSMGNIIKRKPDETSDYTTLSPDEYMEQFDAICIDEAHKAQTGLTIQDILEKANNANYRFGLSGTYNKHEADYYTAVGHLGPLVTEISAHFLITNEYATKININILEIDWDIPNFRKHLYDIRNNKKILNYTGTEIFKFEKDWIVQNNERLEFLSNMISKVTKNSLVLFQNVKDEYGKRLMNKILEKTPNRTVMYVDGNTPIPERELYISAMEQDAQITNIHLKTSDGKLFILNEQDKILLENGEEIKVRDVRKKHIIYYEPDDTYYTVNEIEKITEAAPSKILIASFNTFGTGINIKNLHNIFFIESYKSEQIIRQSIGRGMRLLEGKKEVNVIDIVDNLSHVNPHKLPNDYSTENNYILEHAFERQRIYNEQLFPVIKRVVKLKCNEEFNYDA